MVPAAHSRQEAPELAWYLPTVQLLHLRDSSTENLPGAQKLHSMVLPASGWYLPAGQASQSSWLKFSWVPPGQIVHSVDAGTAT
jgi:hypothetical protein